MHVRAAPHGPSLLADVDGPCGAVADTQLTLLANNPCHTLADFGCWPTLSNSDGWCGAALIFLLF